VRQTKRKDRKGKAKKWTRY